MSKTKLCAGLSALSVSLCLSGHVSADNAKLLELLRQNGTITQQQYDRLKAKDEKQEAAEQNMINALKAETKTATNDYADSFWSKIEPFADFRFRYDYQHFNRSPLIGGDPPDRNRVRIRARFGFLYEVNDNTLIGFGLASGGEDPISSNQTLTDTFTRKPLDLDLAFAQHTFFDDKLAAWLGKFENPYFQVSPLIFDVDLRFEGAALQGVAPLNSSTNVFANAGGYVLDEFEDSPRDAYLLGGQAGAEVGSKDVSKVTGAVGYYNFEDTGEIDETEFTSNTENTFDSVINPNVSVEFYDLGGLYASLYGDYVNNTSADTDETGWLAGVVLGKEEIENLGDWQIGGTYRRLEANASFDEFPESDFRSGGTNVKGWTTGYEIGLGSGFSQRTTFFDASQVDGPTAGERRVQVDLLYKF
jgi:hypothetical protein